MQVQRTELLLACQHLFRAKLDFVCKRFALTLGFLMLVFSHSKCVVNLCFRNLNNSSAAGAKQTDNHALVHWAGHLIAFRKSNEVNKFNDGWNKQAHFAGLGNCRMVCKQLKAIACLCLRLSLLLPPRNHNTRCVFLAARVFNNIVDVGKVLNLCLRQRFNDA